MFEIGDKILYGETGVCLVSDICEKEFIKNNKRVYYVLKPIFNIASVIYAPVESSKIAMRKIISKEMALELINNIPNILGSFEDVTEESIQDYKSEIITHNPQKLVELTSKIYNKKKTAQSQKKRLNAVDDKYMKIAENLLFSELSVVLEIPLEDVPKFIEGKLKAVD